MSKSKRKRGRDPAVSVDDQLIELRKHKIFDKDGKLKTGKKHKKMWDTISKNLKMSTGKKMNPHNIVMCIIQNRNDLKDKLADIEPEKGNEDDICRDEVVINKSKEGDKQCSVFNKLLEIRRNVLYRPSIKVLCQIPFTTFYWPKKVVDFIDLSYDDKTFVFYLAGIFTKNFCIPNEYESQDIVSCILGCLVSGELIPLLHILTEETSESNFKRFLDEMMRSKFRIPKRIVIEHLPSMIEAVIQRFTKSSNYEEFLFDCFTCLEIKEAVKTLPCKTLDNAELSMSTEQTRSPSDILDSIDASAKIDQLDQLSTCQDGIEDDLAVKKQDMEAQLKQILPVCQIVINIRSVILTAKTWDFSDFANQVLTDCRNFILKVILSMGHCDSLSDFQIILYNILILLESKYENQLTENCYNELGRKTQSSLESEYAFQSVQLTSQTNIGFMKCKVIIEYLKTIRKQVQKDIAKEPVGTLDNVFFNKTITIKLLELCVEFPVWTEVMDPIYSITTEQPSTFYKFQDYSDYIAALPKTDCVMSIDEYLLKSMSYTDERVNYGIKHLETTTNRPKKKIEHVKQDDSHLTPEENWKNVNYVSDHSDDVYSVASKSTDSESNDEEEQFFENTDGTKSSNDNISIDVDCNEEPLQHGKMKRKPKKKGTLFHPCPQFRMLQQLPKQRTKKRSLIKNGNDSEKAVKVNSVLVRFLTTSTCDSLSEVIVSSFYSISKFHEYVLQAPKTSMLFTLIKEYAIDFKLSHFYRKRAEILSSFMTETLNGELYWNNSIAAFIHQTLTPSIKQTIICLTCKKETTNRLSYLTIDCQNLSNGNCVLDSLKSVPKRYCTYCGNLAEVECEIEHYLFCDVESSKKTIAIHLDDLPSEFSYKGKEFSLTGVIAFENGLIQPIKHYVAYCRNFCNDSWTKYDDSSNAIEYCTEKQLIVQVAALVYIEYELPIAKAPTENLNAELPQNCNVDFQKMSLETLQADSYPEVVFEESIIQTMNNENSTNQLSLTELRTSDVEMSMNVVTSTPERQQVSVSEVIDLTSLQGSSKKDNKVSKLKRKWIWKDIESAEVTFYHPNDEKEKKLNLNVGGKSRRLIRNGGRHIEKIKIEISKSTYTIKQFANTCATDCIFEIMTDVTMNGGKSISEDIYRNEHRNETIEALGDYSESFDMHQLIIHRAKLLFIRHCSPDDTLENVRIDCQANVCSLFKSFMHSFPCLTVLSKCSSCGKEAERTEATTAINYERFFENNRIHDLQIFVQEELQDATKHCDLCIQTNIRHTLRVSHVIGNYLAIEMDYLYEEATKNIMYDTYRITLGDVYTNVNNIPLELVVNNKKLLLKGMIEFENPPHILMHYVAYTRCLRTNCWTRYNDMLHRIESVPLYEMTRMKIALLLYVAS